MKEVLKQKIHREYLMALKMFNKAGKYSCQAIKNHALTRLNIARAALDSVSMKSDSEPNSEIKRKELVIHTVSGQIHRFDMNNSIITKVEYIDESQEAKCFI